MQLEDAATILSRADFFEICNAEQRRLLAFASERRRHPGGATIYKGGDISDGAHVLVSGTVTVATARVAATATRGSSTSRAWCSGRWRWLSRSRGR